MRKGQEGRKNMLFGEGQRVRITRITDRTSKSCFLGAVGTIRMVEINSNRAAKDADCFYLIRFDRPIDGYWAAGFWGDELEVAGPAPPAPFVAAVGIAEE
jgi:hypothetical protein